MYKVHLFNSDGAWFPHRTKKYRTLNEAIGAMFFEVASNEKIHRAEIPDEVGFTWFVAEKTEHGVEIKEKS
jgi:hypothetical protein